MNNVAVEMPTADKPNHDRSTTRILGRLGRQSVAYSLGSIVGPGTGLLLLPVYTRFLSPADYGLIALLEIVSLVLSSLFSFGITAMVPFYYVDLPSGAARRRAMGTVLIAVTILNVCLAAATAIFSGPIITAILPGVPFHPYVPILAATAFLDPYWAVFTAVLQIEERATAYSTASVARILTSMTMRIVWVVVLNRGVYGFIVANLLTSLATAVCVAPFLCRQSSFSFVPHELRRAFALGAPTVPNNLLTNAFRTIDRVVMDRFLGRDDIGLYYMALRIADVMRLLSDVFISAWRPVFFKEAADPDFRSSVAPMLIRGVSVGFIGIWLFSALFAREAIAILTSAAYRGAAAFVPLLVAAMTAKAIYAFPYLTVWFRRRTVYVPLLTLATLLFSLIATLLLAPRFGAWGVALALFSSYVVLLILMFALAQRIYPLAYPLKEIFTAALVAGAAGMIGTRIEPSLCGELLKFAIVIFVGGTLIATRTIKWGEVRRGAAMLRTMLAPSGDR